MPGRSGCLCAMLCGVYDSVFLLPVGDRSGC